MVHVDPVFTSSPADLKPWQLRQRIAAAARQINDHPELLQYNSTHIPTSPTEPADPLGWIAYYYGVRGDDATTEHVLQHLELGDRDTFYARLDAIDREWNHSVSACVKALEEYAVRHHPDA